MSWHENLSTCTPEEILQSQIENRKWSKEIRRRTNSLVNNRLANEINQAEYLLSRKLAGEEAIECRRRATMLDAQIRRTFITGAGGC